jgi:hypothetical protein
MNPVRILALVLIIAGALGLAYGGFTYKTDDQEAKIGPIDISVQKKHSVDVPVWVGVGAIVVGGMLLLAPRN